MTIDRSTMSGAQNSRAVIVDEYMTQSIMITPAREMPDVAQELRREGLVEVALDQGDPVPVGALGGHRLDREVVRRSETARLVGQEPRRAHRLVLRVGRVRHPLERIEAEQPDVRDAGLVEGRAACTASSRP